MGIFKAAAGSVGGVMADQWREIFVCESMPNDVLAMRGVRKTGERSANTKGDSDVISDGSMIIVNAGQSAIAVDRGEIVGVYTTPGENTYHSDRSKSLFHKGGIKSAVKQSWERFGYGGVAAVYQVIMYIDLKEHRSNEFRVTRAVNIRDRHSLTQMDFNVTMSGMFSFRVVDPAVFYKNICANATGTVKVDTVLPQLRVELAQGLAVGLSRLCTDGALTPTELSEHSDAVAEQVARAITEEWTEKRGFAVTSLAIADVNIPPADMRRLQELGIDKALTDPTMAAAHLTGAHASAMQLAAANESGGIHAVAVMNAAPQPQTAAAFTEQGSPAEWHCPCGSINTTKFCENCGRKRP